MQSSFNIDKARLVSQYQHGTEVALAKADIVGKPDLTALQAFTIYVSIMQHIDGTRAPWILNGLLVRAAVSLNLHRDRATESTGSPLKTESQRRLWWQICLIDSRSEFQQASAFSVAEKMFDTELPTDLDDQALHVTTSKAIIVGELTDTSIFLLRCKIWKFSQQLQHTTDVQLAFGVFRQGRASIEECHSRLFSSGLPLHCFVATTTRLFFNRVELTLQGKIHLAASTKAPVSKSSYNDNVFALYLSILEDVHALQHEPRWEGWRWQIKGRQPPWQALGFVLKHLHECQPDSHSDRALLAISKSLKDAPEEYHQEVQYQQLLVMMSAVERRGELNTKAAPSMNMYETSKLPDFDPSLTVPDTEVFSQDFVTGNSSTWKMHELNVDLPTEADDETGHNPTLTDESWDLGSMELDQPFWDFWNINNI